jgi:hypothetical protein
MSLGRQSKNFFKKGFKSLKGILQVGTGIQAKPEKSYEQDQEE